MPNLDLTVFKDDYDNILNKAKELKVVPLTQPKDMVWEDSDEVEEPDGSIKVLQESFNTFRGPKKALVELSFFLHELYGAGFSFNEDEVLECVY
jgi:hypothetical protein